MEAEEEEAATMAHVLVLTLPAQGHVTPILKLADMISTSGFNVTFVNTEHVHDRFLSSSSSTFSRLSDQLNFRFRTVPDGLPADDPRPSNRFAEVIDSLTSRSRGHYKEILAPCSGRDPDGWPPVSCVIADGTHPFAIDLPDEVGIPAVIVHAISLCSAWANYCIPQLIKTRELPCPENANMDELVRGVEGMEGMLRRRDLPSFIRSVGSLDDPFLCQTISMNRALSRARVLIFNSVEWLEASTLPYIRSVCPNTYTIGPLQLLHQRTSDSTSLCQQDKACITWLDSQVDNSVVYVSFGSLTTMSSNTFLEFWHGLTNSGQPFLWVIRADMVQGEKDVVEIVKAKSVNACFVEWAPQEEVLAHPAIGCFLTHSGWNSTLESLAAGVPMICWSHLADQQINSRFVSEVWGVGVDIKDTKERSVVERAVRGVMEGEEGDKMRRAAREAAKMVRRSVEEGGSSRTGFEMLIQHIKSLCAPGMMINST